MRNLINVKKYFGWIKWQYLAILGIGVVLGMYAAMSWQNHPVLAAKTVTINSRGIAYQITTASADVKGVLLEQGMDLENSAVSPSADTSLSNGMEITYRTSLEIELVDGGTARQISSTVQTVEELLRENQIALGPKDEIFPAPTALLSSGLRIVIQRIEEIEQTEIEPIPFETEKQSDPLAWLGEERVVEEGTAGEREITYRISLKDGREVLRKKISSRVTKAPVGEIVMVGTRIEVESYEYGVASWYLYKQCLCAAHPYYPKGSMLRVTNQQTGASVIVKVNDWGPNQQIHPERVIDLDAVAFKQLAPLSSGTISVKVEKLKTE